MEAAHADRSSGTITSVHPLLQRSSQTSGSDSVVGQRPTVSFFYVYEETVKAFYTRSLILLFLCRDNKLLLQTGISILKNHTKLLIRVIAFWLVNVVELEI